MHVALPKRHINQFKSFQQSRQQVLRVYCPNIRIYTVREGTCSGEHGIGMGKKNILLSQFGHDGIKAMKLVKTALDPLNIMNPGKVID